MYICQVYSYEVLYLCKYIMCTFLAGIINIIIIIMIKIPRPLEVISFDLQLDRKQSDNITYYPSTLQRKFKIHRHIGIYAQQHIESFLS